MSAQTVVVMSVFDMRYCFRLTYVEIKRETTKVAAVVVADTCAVVVVVAAVHCIEKKRTGIHIAVAAVVVTDAHTVIVVVVAGREESHEQRQTGTAHEQKAHSPSSFHQTKMKTMRKKETVVAVVVNTCLDRAEMAVERTLDGMAAVGVAIVVVICIQRWMWEWMRKACSKQATTETMMND